MKGFFRSLALATVTRFAKTLLKNQAPRIVVVAGSVGKTSAKDAIFSVLSKKFHARKSEKSFNTEFGVPLTILGLSAPGRNFSNWTGLMVKAFWRTYVDTSAYPQWLVLEIGVDRPGDMETVAQWLHPDIVVMTHIGSVPVHIEFFSSTEKLIEEKRSIVLSLKKDGLLVVDADDPSSLNTRDTLLPDQTCITCAEKNASDINAGNVEIFYEHERPAGMSFDLFHGNTKLSLKVTRALGRQVIYPALFAYAVGNHLGISDTDIVNAIHAYKNPLGRMHIIEGAKESVIIDDTYNASPSAVAKALMTLAEVKTSGKKIAVIGDMLELGDYSAEEHRKVGAKAAGIAHTLVTVGMRARKIADGALDAGMSESNIFQYDSAGEAGEFVDTIITPNIGDIVLVKGSQAMRMERAVEELMLHPDRKEQLLVRQGPEWLSK